MIPTFLIVTWTLVCAAWAVEPMVSAMLDGMAEQRRDLLK